MLSLLDPLPVTATGLDEHRSGWNYAMSIFKDQSVDPRAVCFHPFFEAIFWDEIWDPFDMEHISFKQKVLEKGGFVACLHNPPKIPIYSSSPTINSSRPIKDHHPILTPDYMINESSIFKELAPLCRGIYTLSEYLSSHVRQLPRIIEHNIPVNTLYHPIEPVENKWSLQKFMDNPDKKLLNIGTWLRRYSSIYRIDPKDTYTKCILPKSNQVRSHVGFQMSKWPGMFAYSRDDVQHIDRVSNTEYDKLLERNIVYLHVFDTSANNVIIECIIRNTPIIVNATPAAIEYLGKDYPLFTTSFEDVERKVHDFDLIEEAHEYLKNYTFKEKLSLEHFKQSIHDSEIYQRLLTREVVVREVAPVVDNTIHEFIDLYSSIFKFKFPELVATDPEKVFYQTITSNLEVRHAYNCYLESKKDIKVDHLTIDNESVYETVLIETRKVPHLEFLIKNAIIKLPGWRHTVICAESNYEYMLNMCKDIHSNIKVIRIDSNIISQNDYNNLLLSMDFWSLFSSEKVLIYQQDTMIFHSNIKEYYQYDYAGAPWPQAQDDNKLGVGNGGLSLRTVSKMVECLKGYRPSESYIPPSTQKYMNGKKLRGNPLDKIPEDVYFSSTLIEYNIGTVCPREEAKEFSQECVKSVNPFGGHQYWLADPSMTLPDYNTYKLHNWEYIRGDGRLHRRGWPVVIDNLDRSGVLSDDGNTLLLDIVEKHFLWDKGSVITTDWVGIIHITPHAPDYLRIIDVDELLKNKQFLDSLPYCKGLVVMSKYLKEYIQERLAGSPFRDVNITFIKHPTAIKRIKKFNMAKFKKNPTWKVIQLGQQLRYVTTIYNLKTDLEKLWMSGFKDLDKMNSILDNECKWLGVTINSNEVKQLYASSHDEYDTLITENIIIINLINASANNAILELLAACTPFFVNKIPSVVEYLGEDYPMYFNNIEEVEAIIADEGQLLPLYQRTWEYLKSICKDDITYGHFSAEMSRVINE